VEAQKDASWQTTRLDLALSHLDCGQDNVEESESDLVEAGATRKNESKPWEQVSTTRR